MTPASSTGRSPAWSVSRRRNEACRRKPADLSPSAVVSGGAGKMKLVNNLDENQQKKPAHRRARTDERAGAKYSRRELKPSKLAGCRRFDSCSARKWISRTCQLIAPKRPSKSRASSSPRSSVGGVADICAMIRVRCVRRRKRTVKLILPLCAALVEVRRDEYSSEVEKTAHVRYRRGMTSISGCQHRQKQFTVESRMKTSLKRPTPAPERSTGKSVFMSSAL